MRRKPSEATLKKLFALSGNRCAFPECTARMVDEQQIVLGEICHLEAAEEGGPRYNPRQTDADRASFGNLILLCATHHKIVDEKPDQFRVADLKSMKARHEKRHREVPFKLPSRALREAFSRLPISFQVAVQLPFDLGKAYVSSQETQRRAAWSLYVELATRIALQPLGTEEGLVREAISSLYNLFGTTREILKQSGPGVGSSRNSVGGIAIAVLNRGLRPFLSRWHPLLQSWEATRGTGVSPREHERAWSREPRLRTELEKLRRALGQYALALAAVARINA